MNVCKEAGSMATCHSQQQQLQHQSCLTSNLSARSYVNSCHQKFWYQHDHDHSQQQQQQQPIKQDGYPFNYNNSNNSTNYHDNIMTASGYYVADDKSLFNQPESVTTSHQHHQQAASQEHYAPTYPQLYTNFSNILQASCSSSSSSSSPPSGSSSYSSSSSTNCSNTSRDFTNTNGVNFRYAHQTYNNTSDNNNNYYYYNHPTLNSQQENATQHQERFVYNHDNYHSPANNDQYPARPVEILQEHQYPYPAESYRPLEWQTSNGYGSMRIDDNILPTGSWVDSINQSSQPIILENGENKSTKETKKQPVKQKSHDDDLKSDFVLMYQNDHCTVEPVSGVPGAGAFLQNKKRSDGQHTALGHRQESQLVPDGSGSQKTNQCNVCGRLYARPSTLKTHLRTHTNERPFKCTVCSKTFSQAANLTAHQRVHTGERPFSCPICSRQFSQSSSVMTHLRTHSGERPYRCAMCSRTFSDSSTLTKHCRIHSGEKPYQCDHCPLNFSQSGNLSRHLKLHSTFSGGVGGRSSSGGSSSIGGNNANKVSSQPATTIVATTTLPSINGNSNASYTIEKPTITSNLQAKSTTGNVAAQLVASGNRQSIQQATNKSSASFASSSSSP